MAVKTYASFNELSISRRRLSQNVAPLDKLPDI
jgi:hypothetical protein